MEPFIFERRQFRRANSDLHEKYIPIPHMLQEIKVGNLFSVYMTWYILWYILTTIVSQNFDNRQLRLDTKRIRIQLK